MKLMFHELFQVTHASGPVAFRPDAVTGMNEYEINGERYTICQPAFEMTRNEFGALTSKETRILLRSEDDNDIEAAGFYLERRYRQGKSEGFGAIDVAVAEPKLENPVFRYLIRVGDGACYTYYFVRTLHDLAELLAKFKMLSETEE